MKASDIPEEDFLAAIDTVMTRHEREGHPGTPASRWCIAWELSGHDPALMFHEDLPLKYPEKVVLAKAKTLVRRGVIDGCACGCRGDFERKR